MSTPQIFLLSPARCGGPRTELLLNELATFDLAVRLRAAKGATLGEVFSFLSGLYFRGKAAYAERFARPPRGVAGAWVLTAGQGLLPPTHPITPQQLREFGQVPIDLAEPRYVEPLARDANALAARLGRTGRAILLGSIATDKYVSVLETAFQDRLLFPESFIGRGDMSRGGLMLRCVREGRELEYIPLAGATRRGSRPAKLSPLPRGPKKQAGT